jgi:cyclopropane-fatty-acyl-phospholipid synthase
MTLAEAQVAKMELVTRKLILDRPGLRVLEMGCGWGALAVHIARTAQARVHAITLSENQVGAVRDLAAAAGVGDLVDVELVDVREVTRRYDRISSVGMFEHVGRPNYRPFFEKVHDVLADDGIFLLHTIGRVDGPGDTDPWLGKYIFPGGYAPALSEIMPHVERAGFYVTDIEILRLHYVRTLKAWYDACMAAKERIVALYDERFFRMWTFYLAASRMAFEHMGHVIFQIQMQKKVKGTVPLTRDYLLGAADDLRTAPAPAPPRPA